jgi:hypothetical protein
MRYIKTYNIFESNNLDSMANQFIADISKSYDLRFGQEFDKNKANCAWFTGEFYRWSKSKGLDVKVVYFDSNIEAHIAPMIDGKVIDFAVKQFTKNPNDDYLILTAEDYRKYGYDKFEIWDEMPELQTVFPADRIRESIRIFESNQIWDLEDICQEIKDEGFSVNIKGVEWGKVPSELGEAKIDITNGSRRGNGISGSNFTMVQSMRDFLYRLKDWAKEEGYTLYVRSNYGMLQLIDDGRIIGTGCTCTPRYPSFSMMEINFAKI